MTTPLGGLWSRIPPAWQTLLVLAAVAGVGFQGRGWVDRQGALPDRVDMLTDTVAAIQRERLPPRLAELEADMAALKAERLPPRVGALEADVVVLKDGQRFSNCVSLESINQRDPGGCERWLGNPQLYRPPTEGRP